MHLVNTTRSEDLSKCLRWRLRNGDFADGKQLARFGGIPAGNHRTGTTEPDPAGTCTEHSDKNAPPSSSVGAVHPGVSRENLDWVLGACIFKKSFRADVGLCLIQIKRNAKRNKQLGCVGINPTVIKPQETQLPKMRVPASRHVKELPEETAEHAFTSLCRCCNYFSMQFLYCPWHCIIQHRANHGSQYNQDTVMNLSASLKLIMHYQNKT